MLGCCLNKPRKSTKHFFIMRVHKNNLQSKRTICGSYKEKIVEL